jgi:WD40 repeat protein
MHSTPDRNQAHTWLNQLAPSEFEQVLLRYAMPQAHLRREVAQSQQAGDLIRYAENRNELGALLALIRQVAPQLAKEIPAQFSNPYKGLATFRAEDTKNQLFYGREPETAKLLKLLAKQNFIALVGVSGSGKSSAVFAGLVPHLPAHWQVIECRPKTKPFRELAIAWVNLLYHDPLDRAAKLDKLENGLYNGEISLAALVQTWSASPGGVPNPSLAEVTPQLLLIIDQFEELYTLNDKTTQQAYLDCLLRLIHSDAPAALLLTLRADFIKHALRFPDFSNALNDHIRLISTLNREALRAVIEKPAQQVGLRLEIGLTERMLDDVGTEPGRLPLLQFALTQLFEQQQQGQLTLAGYQRIGGVEKALAGHADAVLAELREAGLEKAARRALVQLAQPIDGDYTRRVALRRQLPDDIVQKLASKRLVISSEDGVEIIHDSLLRHWQALRDWLNLDREFLLWQTSLRHYLHDQALLRDAPLVLAQDWLAKRGDELQPEERAFIEQSAAKLAQEQAEKRRQQRRWLVFSSLSLVVAVVLISLAAWFWWVSEENAQAAAENARVAEQNEQRAAQNATEAREKFTLSIINQSHMLAGFAEIEWSKSNQNLTMRLALEALPSSSESYPQRPLVEPAYDFLFKAMNRQYQGVLQHENEVKSAVFSPNGTRLLTRSGNFVYLWDMETRQLLHCLKGHKHDVTSTAFSADGKRIVTASMDNTARLWDAATGKEVLTLHGHESYVTSAALSADGRRIVTASTDSTARLWDTNTGKELAVLRGHGDFISASAFSADSVRVITVSKDSTARLWDANTGKELTVLRGHKDWVTAFAFSADGRSIATASSDGTARLWDAVTGKKLAVLSGHENGVLFVAFSPDGKRIVTASGDNTARLWDANTGKELAVLRGHGEAVNSYGGAVNFAAFSPDGGRIVTASTDGTARLWNADNGAALTVLRGHEGHVVSAAFSPDGGRIVTASRDKTARLWDAVTGQQLTALRGYVRHVHFAAFSADGRRIVTASDDYTARLWDAVTGEELRVLRGHEDIVRFAAFNPDGGRIVTASNDKTARLWDAATNQEIMTLHGHEGGVASATFSPDGGRIVTASNDKTARLWDATTGKELAVLRGHEDIVRSAAFSADGIRIVTASNDNTARLWNTVTGKELVCLQGHEHHVNSAAFSPDGGYIVTASQDDTARLWNTVTGKELAVVFRGKYNILSATFSPDGGRIITVSGNGIRLWDANIGDHLTWLENNNGNPFYSGVFSPDGRRIITVSLGTTDTVRLWLTFPTLEDMIAYAKKMLPPRDSEHPGDASIPGWRLTCAERKRYFLEEVERCKTVNNGQ